MKSRLLLLVLCYLLLPGCNSRNPIDLITEMWKKKETEVPMVLIPAGEFQMGSENGDPDEQPVHTVHLNAFYIDTYPVTNTDFKKFVDANPEWSKDNIPKEYHDGDYLFRWNENDYPTDKAEHPVTNVSWYAAMAYSAWVGKRLPTEAEWEKAARGGLIGKEYPWGDEADTTKTGIQLWESPPLTTPIGTYPPNGYGLYDMTGNVWQWCLDDYDAEFYANAPQRNPIVGAEDPKTLAADFINAETQPVLRGGAWTGDPRLPRVANREKMNPTNSLNLVGFRCVRDVATEE